MKILFLSRWRPEPPDNGSKIRISNILKILSERHEVSLITFFDPMESNRSEDVLIPALQDFQLCPYREFDPLSRRALKGFLSPTPRYIVDTYRPEMANLIYRAIEKTQFDLVIASQISMASYYKCFRGIPAIFEEVELGSYWPFDVSQGNVRIRWRKMLTWIKHRKFLSRVLLNFRLCTVASEDECKLAAKAAPHYPAIFVIPNSVDVDRFPRNVGYRIPNTLIFSGSLRYGPNREAMQWFLGEIYPMIREQSPEVQLTITGDPGLQSSLPASNAVLTGHVQDMRPLLASSSVCVAPIRTGGGTRLKIIEAFAAGVPVVSTKKAAEGLDVRGGEHLLIADDPYEFAWSVLHLLARPERARQISQNALALVQAKYDWRIVRSRFLNLIDWAAVRTEKMQS
jgi:polysaccharide biosynthesis protein PslH